MKYYKLLKINGLVKNHRIKFLGLYILHLLKKRYLAVHFDPINACNLRCKMCYFTDKEYVKKLKGVFPPEDLKLFAQAVLKRAIKLQIGCGTEPTLYKNIDDIIILASQYKVPYISLTTNANLIKKNKLREWVSHGLNEITVSLHGVTKNTYQEMMMKGDFDLFVQSLNYINEVKKEFPSFKLRINYTFNEDNFDELKDFYKVFDKINLDILQIRPISKIGNTAYNNFSLKKIIPKYDKFYDLLKIESQKRNVLFLAPIKEQLLERKSITSVIKNYTYFYISPTSFFREDFKWREETFDEYSKRTKWTKKIFKNIFSPKKEINELKNNTLNYTIS